MSTKTNQITVEDAIKWTTAWRKKNPNNCKAFLVPVKDLTEVLIEMNILNKQENGSYVLDITKINGAGVRNYMAIDAAEKEGNGEKILIVGTKFIDGKHKDIINNKPAEGYQRSMGSGIYDFTLPCPTTCDTDSSLNS